MCNSSRSLQQSRCSFLAKSIRVHLTREISHNFAMMRPFSKFQRPADCALRVGSKYTVYILLTYTAVEMAVWPISVVRTFFSPQNMAMTYVYAMGVYITANTVSHKYWLVTCTYINIYYNCYIHSTASIVDSFAVRLYEFD